MKRTTYTTILATILLGSMSHAHAQRSFPDTPLQTSANKPAANIMFILDDSGSMEFDYMPDGMSSSDFYRKNWNINPLSYNPNKTYEPWRNHDGTKMTGGTSYTAAYSDLSRAANARNLTNDYIIFYSPKSATLAKGNTTKSNYYEYAIYTDRGTQYYTRCEYRNSSSGWTNNCVSGNNARPNTARTWAQELENYATWYSYHRTRMKVAKAGVTEAFSQLNGGVRVGYDSIWNRSQMNIPVANDNGLFRNSNKQTWFSRIINADGSGGTPLHGSLARAGAYFQQTGSTGPWGPESGASQYSCRQNFTILTSDGYWNNENGYGSAVQVGNADGTDGVTITSARGETYKYTASRPFTDAFPDTLADVSMHYWKTDLRTDLSNNVPASADNPAFWQHMVTFGISIGLAGSLNPQTDLPSMVNGSKTWPDPWRTSSSSTRSWSNESNRRIDDLWHASVNGRGTFSVATDPDQFSKGLKSALGNIQKTLASGSNVSTSSTSLQTDTRIFHATYYSGIWTGELAAFDISSAGVSQDPSWTASSNIRFTDRKAYTWDTNNGTTFPTTAQSTAMAAGFLGEGVTGTELANYIKGDKSKEQLNGGPFRNRDSLMGDIVNSSPVYSVDTDTLFIGTNGGSLHSVNASTGAENFVYFPKGINYQDLGTVADPEYAHRYFVDGQIAVSNFKQTPGKNYLIAALGRGGKGVFGLDVTAPSSFAANKVMWDSTGTTTDLDMGYVTGEIIIANTNSNQAVALVPNGIDSISGKSALYVINLANGDVIRKIDTGVAGGNGLSSPRGWDENRDGKVDYVYAGDLRGNLWKFDLTSSSPSSWGVAMSGQPLFRAVDGAGNAQPISGGLALGVESFGDNLWILFGTGRYIQQSDITDQSQQTVYGIIDAGSQVTKANLQERTIRIVQGGGGSSNALRSFETFKPLPSGKKGWYINLGTPYAGERVIERGFLSGRMFVFPSVVPVSGNPCESAGKGFINAIDAFTGTSVSHNGANHPYFDVGGDGNKNNDWLTDPNAPVGGDNKLPVGSIETDIGMVTKPVLVGDQIVYGGSSGGKETEKVNLPPGSAKRLSWREVFN